MKRLAEPHAFARAGWESGAFRFRSGSVVVGWQRGPFAIFEQHCDCGIDGVESVAVLASRPSGDELGKFVALIDAAIAAEFAEPLADWDTILRHTFSAEHAGGLFYERITEWPFFEVETERGLHVLYHDDRRRGLEPGTPSGQ